MKHVIAHTYIAQPWTAECFQYDNPQLPKESYPMWVREAWETGHIMPYLLKDGSYYLSIDGNKRTKGYKAFLGDWIIRDEFGHVHVVSQSTFAMRYQRRSK